MFILASNSETRAKILKNFGVEFIQRNCDFDEDSIKSSSPIEFVYQVAKGKKQFFESKNKESLPFLIADTIVVANNTILQKAKDENDARWMLSVQSDNKVSIITCMIFKSQKFEFIDISDTKYIFKKFDEDDLEDYIKSKKWIGKAGACMVEGFCKPYIKHVNGLESTAMGLSIEKLLPFLDYKLTCKN